MKNDSVECVMHIYDITELQDRRYRGGFIM